MADNVIQNIGIKATADTGDTTKKLEELSNGLKKVYESAKGIDTKGMSFGQLKQGLQQAQASLRTAEKDIVKYGNAMGQMWRNAKVDEADAKGRVDAYTNALRQLEKQSSGMKINIWNENQPKVPANSDPYWANKPITYTEWKPSVPIEQFTGEQPLDRANQKTDEAISKLSLLKGKIKEAFTEEKLQSFADRMRGISSKAGELSNKMKGLAIKVGGVGKKFLSALNPMNMFRNEQNKTAHSSNLLGKAFSRLARMFRIMVTRMLIRGFISNIREGFQNIAKYSDEVNQKFSSIISSAKTLYNAFASAFTPIIEAIAPAVTRVLDFITSAMNKVAEFMSALTGKSYFIKATKYQTNYAKSLDKTGKSAGKTAKKVKELKSATIGIDKLNVIEKKQPDTSNSGSGSGAGNGGASANNMFDTKPVSKKMKKLANMVKKIAKKLWQPIQTAWNKVGKKVISSWKGALKDVWKTIKQIGSDFLTMWSQPETEKIFENIFLSFADIGGVVKNLSKNFRKAWKYNNTGLHILENIRDVVGIVVQHIRNCTKYTKNWAKHLNFKPLLQSIEKYTRSIKKVADGIAGVFEDIYKDVILDVGKWLIEKGIPALIDVFTDFNNEVDWKGLRKHLDNVWKGVSHFAKAVGQGLIDFIDYLADGIRDLLNSKWFRGFLDGIGKALKSIKPQQVTSALKTFLKVWLGFKAIKFVSGTLMKTANGIIKISIAIKKLKTAKDILFGASSGLKKLGSSGTTASSGIGGIASKLGKVATAIGVFIAVTKAYEINIGDNGKKIHSSTKNIVNDIENLTEKADELKTNFADTIDNIKVSEIAPYEKVKLYYDELKKITDENGKIKSGYKKQAEFYIKEINKQLGTSVSISGDYVKNLDSANKKLKKQQKLIATKVGNKVLEQNGENYYKAKQGSKDAVDKWIKAQQKWQDAIAHPEKYSEVETEKLAKARNKAYKDYVKFKTIEIRYENLLKAVASGNRKEIEKAVANMNKPIKTDLRPTFDKKVAVKTWKNYLKETIGKVGLRYNNLQVAKDLPKAFKKALTEGIKKGKIDPQKAIDFTKTLAKAKYYGVEINKNLAEKIQNGKIDMNTAIKYVKALSNAKAKGKDISKYVGDGIFKNKKSVTTAINGLKGEVNKLPKKKETKVSVDGKKKYKEDIDDANKKAKTVTTKRSTVLDITINFIGKIAKSLKNAFSTIGDKIKKLFGYGNKKQRAGGGGGGGSFAKGGYPKLGSAFIAGEAGAEFVGTINGKTGVTSNQEITGIREAVVDKGNEQNALLQQQNRLLLQILEKNTDVNIDGVKLTKKINKINARSGYKLATT